MKIERVGCQAGLLDVLQIIFIVFKCIGIITWSWWAVLIPFWIELGVVVFYIVWMVMVNGRL